LEWAVPFNKITIMLQRFMLLVCLLGTATITVAEPVYVNDALEIGLHQDNTLASTIIELIPSGTELELLAREDNLIQVRTQTGITGWVDARYITDSEPGRALIDSLKASLKTSETEIEALEEKLTRAEQQNHAQVSTVTTEQSPIPSTTLREMQNLAEENQRLKQQVAELEAVQFMAVERVQAAENERKQAVEMNTVGLAENYQNAPGDNSLHITNLQIWQQLLLGSILLLAFAIGGWLVDLSVRKRHGGYRI
jgi:SH3 domain protein